MRKVFHIIPTCIKKCQLIQDSTKRDKWDSNADVLKGDKYFTILLPLSNITKILIFTSTLQMFFCPS